MLLNHYYDVLYDWKREIQSLSDRCLFVERTSFNDKSRCQSNQEARPVSTPVCSACHSCAHPLDGSVCCSAIPSANSQLFETYNLVEKGDDDDIEWPENPFDYPEDQNTETTEEYWP